MGVVLVNNIVLRKIRYSKHSRCIYLPQNGAFFTNYVISSTWVTVDVELLRIAGLINYGFRRLFSRSKFECYQATLVYCKYFLIHVKLFLYFFQATVWDFPFGDNYAWMLLIFSIVIVYGVFFPWILPAGNNSVTLHYITKFSIKFFCV